MSTRQRPKSVEASRLLQLRYDGDSLHETGIPVADGEALAAYQVATRQYLAQAVRIVPGLAPELAAVVQKVSERAAPALKIEGYVYNSSEVQASSLGGGEGALAVALSSGLVRLLSPGELAFVIGHELGHYIMGHHRYPRTVHTSSEVERLNHLAVKRAAEISADRVGFVASPSRDDALRALLKVASGLPERMLRFDVGAFLDQSRDLVEMGGSEIEVLSSHPMFSARVRALLWFEMSDLYYEWLDNQESAPLSRADLEERVEKDLAAAGGFRLAQLNEDAISRGYMWGALALFVSDNRLSSAEQALLRRAVDTDRANKAIDFARRHGPDAIKAKLQEALAEVRGLPIRLQQSLVEDLARLALHSDGERGGSQRVLAQISGRLKLSQCPRKSATGEEHGEA